jgi:DNA-binding transcriptional regulator/RsmH inhibitor MraZ
MTKLDFSVMNKATSDSFHKQKAKIKKVLAGKTVNCDVCKQSLVLVPKNSECLAYIKCAKDCTNIELEVDN